MGAPEESKPLLQKSSADVLPARHPVAPPPQKHLAVAVSGMTAGEERAWTGGLLHCFGSCDINGVSTAALVHAVPAVPFAHNVRRALGRSFWTHAILFCLLFSVWSYAYLASSFRVAVTCGPDFPHHPPHMMEPHAMMQPYPGFKPEQQILSGATLDEDLAQPQILSGATLDEDILVLADSEDDRDMLAMPKGRKLLHKKKSNKDKKKEEEDNDEDEHEHKEHKEDHHKKWLKDLVEEFDDEEEHGDFLENPECRKAVRHLQMTWTFLAVSFLVGVVYAAKMRTRIRNQFNIPGSRCADLWTWLCCSFCALAQETRTLTHNNVNEGVWYGPTMFAASAEQQSFVAPVQQAATKAAPTKPEALHVPSKESV